MQKGYYNCCDYSPERQHSEHQGTDKQPNENRHWDSCLHNKRRTTNYISYPLQLKAQDKVELDKRQS